MSGVSTFGVVLGQLLALLPKDTAKEVIDDVLDKVEKKIADSETKWDDNLVQPMIDKLREVSDIPDDINGDED